MSNPWAQSFDDLRSPYLQEKKAKKDYDGDGKIESGAKEYRGVVHNKIQKAKGGKADGQDTSSVKEGKVATGPRLGEIRQKGATHANAGEGEKIQKRTLAYMKRKGQKGAPGLDAMKERQKEHEDRRGKKMRKEEAIDEKYDDSKVSMRFGDKKQKERKDKLEKKRGMKLDKHPQFKEAKEAPRKQKGAMAYDGPNKARSMAADRLLAKAKAKRDKMKMEHHQKDASGNPVDHGDGTPSNLDEADKKGKGSGKKDACYHKVKSRYDVWPSAYASGALVKCRKVGAKNWGKKGKKEEFDYYQMPMKSFGDMVGECWKTHERVPGTVKGAKGSCRPKGSGRTKNESVEEAVKIESRIDEKKDPRTQITSVDVKLNSGAYKAYSKDPNASFGTSKRFNPIIKTVEAVKSPKLDIKETGVKNKIEINPEIKTEAAKAPVKK